MDGLTVLQVRHAKPGRYADGNGLYLHVGESGSRAWVLRVVHVIPLAGFEVGSWHISAVHERGGERQVLSDADVQRLSQRID